MSDDDAIPVDSGEASETGTGTEGVGFKVKADIQYSSHRIEEIKAHTSVNSIKDRRKIFQDAHDAQASGQKVRPSTTPDKAAQIASRMSPRASVEPKAKADIQYSSHRIDEIKAHTSVNSIKDRSKIFQDKHDAQSPTATQKRYSSSPAAERPSAGESATVFESATEAAVEAEAEEETEAHEAEAEEGAAATEEEAEAEAVVEDEDEAEADTAAETTGEEAETPSELPSIDTAATTPAPSRRDSFHPSTNYDNAEDAKLNILDEAEGDDVARPSVARESVMVKKLHECPFTYPFDKNGAIWWIGTEGGKREYENPQLTGELYLEISTLYRGKLDNLTSYATPTNSAERIAAATYTNNSSHSWLVVDFGPERALRPSYYALKHGASGIGNAVRNWVLEAQVDEFSPWVTLRTHENDTSMRQEPQSVAGYELNNDKARAGFYRVFRLKQTGKNSGGNDCLFIGGIEFYGIMKITQLQEIGEG